jgi:LPS-assembly protein
MRDNMDAAVYLDYFSEKGLGTGLDYRYMLSSQTKGEFWLYHLRDNDLLRDFFEIKSYHNHELPFDISSYLKLHVVNEFDYYNVLDSTSSKRIGWSKQQQNPFGFTSEERLQKYLESNLQFTRPLLGGRTYVLGQYRQSLEDSSGNIPQSMPEAGFIVNTRKIGPAFFRFDLTGINFRRDNGQQGQRLDINPDIFLSLGRIINFTQKIGLRETLYFLKNPSENQNRELLELKSTLTTRFLKRYDSFIHIIEPSVSYAYIPDVDQSEIPSFDSKDFIPQTSDITYSFTNRLTGSVLGGAEGRLRLSQSFSLLDTERPFSPVQLESNLSSRYIDFSANVSYNVYNRKVTDTIAQLYLKSKWGYIGTGKNLRRSTNLDQYTFEAGLYRPLALVGSSLPIDLHGNLWYDVKGGGVQEFNLKSTYSHQCWGLTVIYHKKPFEYSVLLSIEFKGFGTLKIG